jgi:hypothetical protein
MEKPKRGGVLAPPEPTLSSHNQVVNSSHHRLANCSLSSRVLSPVPAVSLLLTVELVGEPPCRLELREAPHCPELIISMMSRVAVRGGTVANRTRPDARLGLFDKVVPSASSLYGPHFQKF